MTISITFDAGSNTNIVGSFIATGTSPYNLVNIGSSIPGTPFTLYLNSNTTSQVTYASLNDLTLTGTGNLIANFSLLGNSSGITGITQGKTLGSSLNSNGVLQVPSSLSYFDEVTNVSTSRSINQNSYQVGNYFDEVTLTQGTTNVASKLYNTGVLMVSGQLDEVTRPV